MLKSVLHTSRVVLLPQLLATENVIAQQTRVSNRFKNRNRN